MAPLPEERSGGQSAHELMGLPSGRDRLGGLQQPIVQESFCQLRGAHLSAIQPLTKLRHGELPALHLVQSFVGRHILNR